MKFFVNIAAAEITGLDFYKVHAVRIEPQERKRQKRTNLKFRALQSQSKAVNQSALKRNQNQYGFNVSFRVERAMLDNLGIVNLAKKRYQVVNFGSGYFELVPVSQNYKFQPNEPMVLVR